MSLQFILGASGSGKSTRLYTELTKEAQLHPKKNYLVVVPEQFTLSTQQKLVELSPGGAIMNVDVLSFKRLAYRVFDDLGMSDLPILEETGKDLVLRRIAQEQDQNLTVLGRNMSRMGYVDQMKSLISEFMQYNVTPERLREVKESGCLAGSLSGKMDDILIMYEEFRKYMKEHYITAEEILNVLKDLVSRSDLLKDSVIAFDEFTGFTPIQYDLLQEMLLYVDRMYVTLTIDLRDFGSPFRKGEGLFDMTKDTINRLTKRADLSEARVEEPLLLEDGCPRFGDRGDLSYLERNLFRMSAPFEGKPDNIFLYSMQDPRDEIVYAARQIGRLVREEGYRYKEIAVISGSVDSYGNYAATIFDKYKIPYFLDQTVEVSYSPFIDFLRAALDMIVYDFDYASVMRFLRCGFLDMEEKEIDLLDNYLVSTGICHRRVWEKTWLGRRGKSRDYDLTLMEQLRCRILEVLKPLLQVFDRKNALISDGIMGLYRMMTSLGLEEKLWALEKKFTELGLQAKAKEYGQIYAALMSMLEKYNDLLGDEPLEAEAFRELFEAGLSAIKVGAVPPGYDSVTIGDVERTRLDGVKAVFLVGVNDGLIPKTSVGGGIISEYERRDLEEAGIELAPNLRERAFIQRFYLYRNLTKPSHRLYISYARSGSDGKSINPSYLIASVKRMYPGLEEGRIEDASGELAAFSIASGRDYLVHKRNECPTGELPEEWYALAKVLKEEDRDRTETLLTAPYTVYRHFPLSRNVARTLYGDILRGSITRLEKFSECAYAHFLRYGLGLSERERAGLDALDVGILYHSALEHFGRYLSQSEYDWFTLPEENRIRLAKQSLEEALRELTHVEFLEAGADTYQLSRMEDIFQRNIAVFLAQIRRGHFKPEDFELKFTGKEDNALIYSLKNGRIMNLVGKIDRLDTFREEGRIYVKIIDYKTGSEGKNPFDLNKVYHGLQLQLAVYLMAALEAKKEAGSLTLPGGILYQRLDDPVLEESDEPDEDYLKAMRPVGLINDDPEVYVNMDGSLAEAGTKSAVIPVERKKDGDFTKSSTVVSGEALSVIRDYAVEKLMDNGSRIYDGEIQISPVKYEKYESCAYCPYRSVCCIDSRIPGYKGRKLKKSGDTAEILENMKAELAVMKGQTQEK